MVAAELIRARSRGIFWLCQLDVVPEGEKKTTPNSGRRAALTDKGVETKKQRLGTREERRCRALLADCAQQRTQFNAGFNQFNS